jgi:universal stress protein A
MTWQTLLVPHDYSPCADRALALAAELALHHKARLVLAHVTYLPPGLTADALITDRETGEMIRLDAHARAEAIQELEQRAAPLRAAGIDVTIEIGIGEIAGQILDLAATHRADLIVIGTHGRTGLAHLLMGSIAEKVLRYATVPVLTVREKAEARRTTSEMVLSDLATD